MTVRFHDRIEKFSPTLNSYAYRCWISIISVVITPDTILSAPTFTKALMASASCFLCFSTVSIFIGVTVNPPWYCRRMRMMWLANIGLVWALLNFFCSANSCLFRWPMARGSLHWKTWVLSSMHERHRGHFESEENFHSKFRFIVGHIL